MIPSSSAWSGDCPRLTRELGSGDTNADSCPTALFPSEPPGGSVGAALGRVASWGPGLATNILQGTQGSSHCLEIPEPTLTP